MPRPNVIPVYPSREWVIVTCALALWLCVVVTMKAATIWMYGVAVLWNGIPEALDRGPGDGFVILFAMPVAVILWVIAVGCINTFVKRRRAQALENGHHANAA